MEHSKPVITDDDGRNASAQQRSCQVLSKSFYYKLYFAANRTGRYTLRVRDLISHTFHYFWKIALSELFEMILEKIGKLFEIKRSPFGRGELSFSKSILHTVYHIADQLSSARREASRYGARRGFARFFREAGKSFRTYWASHRRILNYGAPIAGIAMLALTVYMWTNASFALKVTYNGKTLGYVRNEQIFRAAVSGVEEDVSAATGDSFALTYTPRYQLLLVGKNELSSKKMLEQNIISGSDTQVQQGYGLYVDNRLVAVNGDKQALNDMLSGILAAYKQTTSDTKVQFVQGVRVDSGLFPLSACKSIGQIKALLTQTDPQAPKSYVAKNGDSVTEVATMFNMPVSRLYDMNPVIASNDLHAGDTLVVDKSQPLLSVQEVRLETYAQSIPFNTKNVNSSTLTKGQQKVQTKGSNGTALVTAEVTYVDGVSVGSQVVSTQVSTPAVDQVIYVGTAQKTASTASSSYSGPSIAGSGSLGWPLANGAGYVSCPFGGYSGHSGMDVASSYGTPIVAADSGTVIFAGWDGGYGNCVKINHGNGIVTLYGHASKLLVSAGQNVSKGQVIALVGATGNATGNHVHFEVQVNGVAVNPARFLK